MAERDAPTLGYRPGLDGIRALAVAGVFLYHARVSWLPGGFLGVDVFFALSGYLITSLLLVEWERAGRIDLRRFWGRRARRLLPAVVLVIAVAVLATATIARDDLARTRGDAISSLFYFTNWHLIAASHSYFDAFGRPSLLQHLWSLAVEEQFYVLWPLLLVAGLALLGRRRLLPLVLAAIGGSTALAWLLYDPERDPSRVYYGTDTRAATLLVGALLAFLWHDGRRSRIRLSRRGVALLDVVGLAALAATLGFFWQVQDYDPRLYRGGLLAVAVCATVLVGVVAHPETRLGRLLGREPLRWLGVRSYGIYLWHWPVVVLSRPGIDVPWRGPGVIVAQGAVVVALAGLSYRFVEQPIRSGAAQRRLRAWLLARPQPQRLAAAVAVPGVLATGIAVLFAISPPPARVEVAAAQSPPLPEPSAALAEQPPTSAGTTSPPQTRRETLLSPPARGPLLAVGDSVMLGCSPALERRLGRRLRVDAVVARQTVDVVDRLAAYRSRGALPGTVVVQVGDNGPAWYADLVRLRRTLAPVRRVVLVNVRVDRSWQGQVDQQLARFVSTWPRARIANWYGSSSDGVLEDGVHPTPAGCDTYAGVIARTLAGETRASG